MPKNPEILIVELEQLDDILEKDIESLSEEDLLNECSEDFGSIDNMIDTFHSLLDQASLQAGRSRLEDAKKGYKESMAEKGSSASTILNLPLESKLSLLDKIKDKNDGLTTLAARNDKDSEADIDAILEDLIELGALNDDGTVK